MSGDAIDADFKEFLTKNKIDLGSLEGLPGQEERFNVKEKRALNILKAVIYFFNNKLEMRRLSI